VYVIYSGENQGLKRGREVLEGEKKEKEIARRIKETEGSLSADRNQ